MMKSTALFLSFALLAGTAAAQDNLKMHRKQAGEAPDASGWMLAKSTEGRFSVRLPLKFNDFTLTERDPGAPAARTHVVGVRSSERIALTATRIVYRKGAASAKEYFARFEKGEGLGAKPESIKPLKLGQLRALDLVVKRGAEVSYQRVVLLDADLLLMVVEAPREHDPITQQIAPTFFASLQVDAK
jgi:hypothetical protein